MLGQAAELLSELFQALSNCRLSTSSAFVRVPFFLSNQVFRVTVLEYSKGDSNTRTWEAPGISEPSSGPGFRLFVTGAANSRTVVLWFVGG
jgi:hypothetical protein